jgi:hypothetical protein
MAPPASARAAAPSTVEAGGYAYPTEETIGGQPVELNGTGVRKMAFFKVYSMGMYLPHRTTSATEAVQMPGNKGFTLYMMRDLPMTLFMRLMIEGIETGATDQELHALQPSIDRLKKSFADVPPAKEGDKLTINWINGTGAVISLRGKAVGEPYADPLFFRRIINVWLGEDPVQSSLKASLLKG